MKLFSHDTFNFPANIAYILRSMKIVMQLFKIGSRVLVWSMSPLSLVIYKEKDYFCFSLMPRGKFLDDIINRTLQQLLLYIFPWKGNVFYKEIPENCHVSKTDRENWHDLGRNRYYIQTNKGPQPTNQFISVWLLQITPGYLVWLKRMSII